MYPDPLFTILGIPFDLYNIMLVTGIALCIVFIVCCMKREKFERSMSDIIILCGFLGILFGILFASLFQSVYDYIENPSQGFKFGGMTFIGGLIGGITFYVGFYCLFIYLINPKLKDKNVFKCKGPKTLFDALKFIPIGITIAHCVGRIGCFFAGCCYGKPTDAWYGIQFQTTDTKVIPTQLFEAIFLFVLAASLSFLYFKFNFKYGFGIYGIAYGIWRFIIEFFRGDHRGTFVGNLSPSQFWSIFFVIGGIAFIFLYRFFYIKRAVKQQNKEENASN